MKHSKENGFSVIIIAIVVLLLIAGGAGIYYFFSFNNEETQLLSNEETKSVNKVEKTTTETGKAESPFGNFTITSDVTTTEECDTEGCFSEKFSSCTPSSLSAESPLGSIYYEIIEPKENGCSVKIMYTQNPNPEWVNKEMVCTMNNSLEFQKSVEETFNDIIAGNITCTGPLFSLLSNL